MATHSSTLAWKIPWMVEPVGCSPWGHKELDTTERLHFTLKGYTSRKGKSKKDQLNSHKGSTLTQMRLRWSASILTALQKQKKISGERQHYLQYYICSTTFCIQHVAVDQNLLGILGDKTKSPLTKRRSR